MRRMYSEQELTKIIKEVSEAYIDELIEDGEFDQKIEDYVDAYLVEHPWDATAITGHDISPKDVSASGNITAPSIIETMSGYSFTPITKTNITITPLYASAVKNGNKLTLVLFTKLTRTGEVANGYANLGQFTIPTAVMNKLVPYTLEGNDVLASYTIYAYKGNTSKQALDQQILKYSSNTVAMLTFGVNNLVQDNEYFCRCEVTFLLSSNFIS